MMVPRHLNSCTPPENTATKPLKYDNEKRSPARLRKRVSKYAHLNMRTDDFPICAFARIVVRWSPRILQKNQSRGRNPYTFAKILMQFHGYFSIFLASCHNFFGYLSQFLVSPRNFRLFLPIFGQCPQFSVIAHNFRLVLASFGYSS